MSKHLAFFSTQSHNVVNVSNMKRILSLTAFSVVMIHNLHAQWSPNGSSLYYNAGNIGIGTSTPSLPLSIVSTGAPTAGFYRSVSGGTIPVGAALGQNTFGVYNSTTGSELAGGWMRGVATQTWTPGTAQGAGFAFNVTANNTTTPFEAMRVDHNGRLGIGTSTPATALQIGNTTGNSFITLAGGSTGNSYGINYAFNNPGSNIYAQTMLDWDTRATRGLQFNTQGGYGFSFNTIDNTGAYQNNLVTITGAGKVGIGASSPSSTLEVNTGSANAPSGLVLNQGTDAGNPNSARLFFSNAGDITTNSFSIFKNGNNLVFSYGANPGTSSGTQALFLKNDGNVGIGTNNPVTALDVTGTVRSSLFMAASQSPTDQLTHNGVSMSHYGLGWMNDSWQSGSSTAWLSGYGGIKLFTGGTNRLNIDINGNVGIGKIATAKLDVNGGVYANAESHYYIGAFTDPDPGTAHAIKVGSNGIAVSGNSVFSNGYVMVGSYPATMNTSYLLNVNGDARVNKLVVNTTGADFVFEPTYKLLPLNQLEKYVILNRHLPGIETANTMQRDGVDVGENQTKLLQKVEELTLYIINQNKAIDELRKELDELKASKK